MTIAETLQTHMIEAMKAKDALRLSVIRGAKTAFTNEVIAKGGKPTDAVTDDVAIAVLKRLAKQRKDSAEQFRAGNRPELAEKEDAELVIIEAYLPAQASEEDIEKVVKAKIAELNVTDKSGIGKLTGAVVKHFGGNADGTVVKRIAESLL
jgi:hypothetical protein